MHWHWQGALPSLESGRVDGGDVTESRRGTQIGLNLDGELRLAPGTCSAASSMPAGRLQGSSTRPHHKYHTLLQLPRDPDLECSDAGRVRRRFVSSAHAPTLAERRPVWPRRTYPRPAHMACSRACSRDRSVYLKRRLGLLAGVLSAGPRPRPGKHPPGHFRYRVRSSQRCEPIGRKLLGIPASISRCLSCFGLWGVDLVAIATYQGV